MPTDGAAPGEARLDRDLVVLCAVLLVGAVAALLDTTIVAIAVEEIGDSLGAPVASVQWVSSAYLLAMAAVLPTMGWLVDRHGAKRVWLAALAAFGAGSLLCAAAWSAASLAAARVVQGLGGGLLLPLVQAVIAQEAGPRRVGRAMALVGIPGNLAPVLGPVAGGALVATAGWRWIFALNVPVTAVAMVLAARCMPERAAPVEPAPSLDRGGLVLAVVGMTTLVGGLTAVGRSGEGGQGGPWVVVGLVVLGWFVLRSRRRGAAALVDVALLARRRFAGAAGLMFGFGVALYGPMLLLPLFFSQVRGAGVAEVGWLLAPQGLGTVAALVVAGRAADRLGPRRVAVAGLVLCGAGTVAFAAAGPTTTASVLTAALVLRGFGLGTVGVAAMAGAYIDLPRPAVPRATTLLNITQRVGASLGTSVLVTVLAHRLPAGTTSSPGAAAPAFRAVFGFATVASLAALVPAAFLAARPESVPGHTQLDDPFASRGGTS